VIANETESDTPKNVVARSTRNILVIDSTIIVEKKAIVKAGTRNIPIEDLSSLLGSIQIFPKYSNRLNIRFFNQAFIGYAINNLTQQDLLITQKDVSSPNP